MARNKAASSPYSSAAARHHHGQISSQPSRPQDFHAQYLAHAICPCQQRPAFPRILDVHAGASHHRLLTSQRKPGLARSWTHSRFHDIDQRLSVAGRVPPSFQFLMAAVVQTVVKSPRRDS